jgi:hypothetical protein
MLGPLPSIPSMPSMTVAPQKGFIRWAVRLAQKGMTSAEYLPPEFSKQAVTESVRADQVAARRRDPDATVPPVEETAFEFVA